MLEDRHQVTKVIVHLCQQALGVCVGGVGIPATVYIPCVVLLTLTHFVHTRGTASARNAALEAETLLHCDWLVAPCKDIP